MKELQQLQALVSHFYDVEVLIFGRYRCFFLGMVPFQPSLPTHADHTLLLHGFPGTTVMPDSGEQPDDPEGHKYSNAIHNAVYMV